MPVSPNIACIPRQNRFPLLEYRCFSMWYIASTFPHALSKCQGSFLFCDQRSRFVHTPRRMYLCCMLAYTCVIKFYPVTVCFSLGQRILAELCNGPGGTSAGLRHWGHCFLRRDESDMVWVRRSPADGRAGTSSRAGPFVTGARPSARVSPAMAKGQGAAKIRGIARIGLWFIELLRVNVLSGGVGSAARGCLRPGCGVRIGGCANMRLISR